MNALLSIVAITSVSVLGPAASDRDDHMEIPISEVPEVVRKAADKAAPSARWTDAERSARDGNTYYFLEGEDDKGRHVEIALTGEGKVHGLLVELTDAEVPEAVKEAVRKEVPKFQVDSYFKAIRDGELFEYIADGQKDGEEMVLGIDPEGKKVRVVPADE